MQATELAAKRLELLREVLPGLRQLAILGNVDYPASVVEMGEFCPPPACLASTSIGSKSGVPRISRPPSPGSRSVHRRSTCVATRC